MATVRAASNAGSLQTDADSDDAEYSLLCPNPIVAILDGYKQRVLKQPDVALRQMEDFWK